MKNVQVIDRADNATFSVFQATDDEFSVLFPALGQDIELIEEVMDRIGEEQASKVLGDLWQRPILKREVHGIHGTLYYGSSELRWRQHIPSSKREIDTPDRALNEAQRRLFAASRQAN